MFLHKILTKTIFAIVAAAFLLFSLFGVVISIGSMKINSDGVMTHCLLMNHTPMYPMSFTEHINLWQTMFSSLLPSVSLMNILILALSLVLTQAFNNLSILSLEFLLIQYRIYLKQHPHISLFNFLKEAFSQGILNPKIYELSTI